MAQSGFEVEATLLPLPPQSWDDEHHLMIGSSVCSLMPLLFAHCSSISSVFKRKGGKSGYSMDQVTVLASSRGHNTTVCEQGPQRNSTQGTESSVELLSVGILSQIILRCGAGLFIAGCLRGVPVCHLEMSNTPSHESCLYGLMIGLKGRVLAAKPDHWVLFLWPTCRLRELTPAGCALTYHVANVKTVWEKR